MMVIKWKQLLLCVAIPLSVGGLSALLTKSGMEQFATLNQPPLSPPGWLFPVVWTLLYALMGIASCLVLSSGKPRSAVRTALAAYGAQLVVNFFWSIIFFNLERYLFAFLWLLLLWALILLTLSLFRPLSKVAAKLMIPYLLWVSFAGYLNFGVWLLN